MELIQRALRVRPHRAFFQNSLGEIHRAAGHTDLALASYRGALRVKEEPGTWSNMALALSSVGRGEEAEYAFHAATALDTRAQPTPLLSSAPRGACPSR